MRVIDIINEERKDAATLAQMKDDFNRILKPPPPADYDKTNKLHKGWYKVILKAFNRCWNSNNEAAINHLPLDPRRKFNVTFDYLWKVVTNQNWICPQTKLPLEPLGDTKNHNRISIDRIDSSKGYIVGNVQFTTYRFNVMKWNDPENVFHDTCEQIVKYTMSNGIPNDPSDNYTSDSLLEARRLSIFEIWELASQAGWAFIDPANTSEPLYTNLANKNEPRTIQGITIEKKYFTPVTIGTIETILKAGKVAYDNNDKDQLSFYNNKLTMAYARIVKEAVAQLKKGKYPQELGANHCIVDTLKVYKEVLPDLIAGKQMKKYKGSTDAVADGAYTTKPERDRLAQLLSQIDPMLQLLVTNPPPYEEAVNFKDSIKHAIYLIAVNTDYAKSRGITPEQFLVSRATRANSQIDVDDHLTPDQISNLDSYTQMKIAAARSKGQLPSDWDKSNPEHTSWKKVLDKAFNRVHFKNNKRDTSGLDKLERHNADVSYEHAWAVIKSQNWTCPYTGTKLEVTGEGTANQLSPDRINSELGYSDGNVRFVTYKVNMMKGNMSSLEFVKRCYAATNTPFPKNPKIAKS